VSGGSGASDDVLLALAGWPGTEERILGGICHDMNGRVAALRGLLQLTGMGDDPRTLTEYLEDEVRRLERMARMLALFPDHTEGGLQMMAPGEVLPDLLLLHGKHRGLEGITTELVVDPEAPAFRASRRRLQRALLVALGAVAWSALGRGGRSLLVTCAPSGAGGLSLRVSPGKPADRSSYRAPPPLTPTDAGGERVLDALRQVMERDRISLESEEDEDGLRLVLLFQPLA